MFSDQIFQYVYSDLHKKIVSFISFYGKLTLGQKFNYTKIISMKKRRNGSTDTSLYLLKFQISPLFSKYCNIEKVYRHRTWFTAVLAIKKQNKKIMQGKRKILLMKGQMNKLCLFFV